MAFKILHTSPYWGRKIGFRGDEFATSNWSSLMFFWPCWSLHVGKQPIFDVVGHQYLAGFKPLDFCSRTKSLDSHELCNYQSNYCTAFWDKMLIVNNNGVSLLLSWDPGVVGVDVMVFVPTLRDSLIYKAPTFHASGAIVACAAT